MRLGGPMPCGDCRLAFDGGRRMDLPCEDGWHVSKHSHRQGHELHELHE